jgi:hypothetical protein
MAYAGSTAASSVANPPWRVDGGFLSGRSVNESTAAANGGGVWVYNSTETLAAVAVANYFTDAQRLGMRSGDIILCSLRTGEASSDQLFEIGVICEVSTSGAQLSSVGNVTSNYTSA